MHNPSKAILHSRVIHPNGANRPRAIRPNEINRPTRNLPKRNRRGGHPRAILSSKMRRGGACVPARTFAQRRFHTKKIHAWCAGNERWMRPYRATRAGTQAPPLPNSTKPCGVPLPHRGYTFDSAGLASATQPTLGNDASEETTPLGGCTFSHRTSLPYATNGLFANDFHTRKLILKSTMPMA